VHQLCRTLPSSLHCDHDAAQCTNHAHRVALVNCAEKTVENAISYPESRRVTRRTDGDRLTTVSRHHPAQRTVTRSSARQPARRGQRRGVP
jgi:hypothetical protein